jgi:hypothetical protein
MMPSRLSLGSCGVNLIEQIERGGLILRQPFDDLHQQRLKPLDLCGGDRLFLALFSLVVTAHTVGEQMLRAMLGDGVRMLPTS